MKEFDRIIGYASIKQELAQLSDVLKNPGAYARLGVSAPRGLMLHGEPGLGKTLMAQCLAEASGRKAYFCRKNEPNGDFVRAIKSVFAEAARNEPAVVVLDDLDKFANDEREHSNCEEYVTVQACIDEVKGQEVFVVATANDPDDLPPSLLRAGRFDRIIEVKTPAGAEAVAIIRHYLQDKPVADELDAEYISQLLKDSSCAQLESVINEAGLLAGFARRSLITRDDFIRACLHQVFSVSELPRSMPEDCDLEGLLANGKTHRTVVAWHEAGHALISEALLPGSVLLLAVHGREGRESGFVQYADINLQDRLSADILIGLGGMAALEQQLGLADGGAAKDLSRVSRLIWQQVARYGMSGFAVNNVGGSRPSETTEYQQEQIVAAELTRYYRQAKAIIARNRPFLAGLAQELFGKGLLCADDVQRIRDQYSLAAV